MRDGDCAAGGAQPALGCADVTHASSPQLPHGRWCNGSAWRQRTHSASPSAVRPPIGITRSHRTHSEARALSQQFPQQRTPSRCERRSVEVRQNGHTGTTTPRAPRSSSARAKADVFAGPLAPPPVSKSGISCSAHSSRNWPDRLLSTARTTSWTVSGGSAHGPVSSRASSATGSQSGAGRWRRQWARPWASRPAISAQPQTRHGWARRRRRLAQDAQIRPPRPLPAEVVDGGTARSTATPHRWRRARARPAPDAPQHGAPAADPTSATWDRPPAPARAHAAAGVAGTPPPPEPVRPSLRRTHRPHARPQRSPPPARPRTAALLIRTLSAYSGTIRTRRGRNSPTPPPPSPCPP